MRVVFFGSSRLGARCCRLLLEEQLAQVVGIFTTPREFRISYSDAPVVNVLHEDFAGIGQAAGIPVVNAHNGVQEHERQLAGMCPDLLLVAGWYHQIPRFARMLAAKGCVGIHASLLPKYRGGAPLVWAMINGESQAGVSLFHLEDEVDSGDIVGQAAFAITEEDSIAEVLEKGEDASIALLREMIPRLQDGSAPRRPQRHEAATHFPQRTPADGLIDWSWDARRIHNFIRAQTRPYPGAYTIIDGKKITLWNATVADRHAPHPLDR